MNMASSPVPPLVATGDRPAFVDIPRRLIHSWQEVDELVTLQRTRLNLSAVDRQRSVVLLAGRAEPSFVIEFLAARAEYSVCVVDPRWYLRSAREIAARLEALGYANVLNAEGVRINGHPKTDTVPPGQQVLLASGGTTGAPQLHRFDVSERTVRGVIWAFDLAGWRECPTHLVVSPVFHAWGLLQLVAGIESRQTLAFLGDYSTKRVLEAIRRFSIDWLGLTPGHMRQLADADPDGKVLQRVRAISHSSAPCDPELKLWWIKMLGAQSVLEVYSSTEQTGLVACLGDEWLEHPGTVGRGFFTSIRITDEAGAELPAGEVGLVRMRASRQGKGSRGDGYQAVGDLGRLDELGYLYLHGRVDDVFLVGGENVYPSDIENFLRQQPGVIEAVVIPRPNRRLGNVVHALIEVDTRIDVYESHLLRACKSSLSNAARPVSITIVDKFPRTPVGKVDRRAIRDTLRW